ncbi:MAG: FtsW/RodA/SpoVE family cell cycle protein [Patescibacteria group bacterium]
MRGRLDKTLLFLLIALIVGGCFIFASAAFGLLARGQSGMTSIVLNHLVLGVGLGLVLLVMLSVFDYRHWRIVAPYLFGLSLFATALVFVPQIGFTHGGGTRWLDIFGLSVQPSEALKITSVILAAAYFSAVRGRAESLTRGLGGFFAIIAPSALLLLLQPDIGTLFIICIPVFAVYVAAGARWRDIAIAAIVALICLSAILYFKDHARQRLMTFLDPSRNQQASGYQIRQSLIAIGSGEFLGRGFGQGVQKFTYLPEPMGDSIFAVAAEELGFVGSVTIVLTFLGFVLRGYGIAARAPDFFAGLLAVGISTYLVSEAFINIAAMLGVAPLTGIPLTFVSQGGTAMLVSLASAGILLNISRHRRASNA